MSMESQKRKELQKLIELVKSNYFVMHTGRPYIYFKRNFFLCSLKNLEILANEEPIFYLVNRINYKNFIHRVLMYHQDNVFKEEPNLKFKNTLIELKKMKSINPINEKTPYFCELNISLNNPKEKEFPYIDKFIENMTHSYYEDFYKVFSKIFKVKNDSTIILKVNKEGIKFIHSFIEFTFKQKNYKFLTSANQVNVDDMFEKNIVTLNSSLLKDKETLSFIRRNLIKNGSIVKQDIMFRGMIIIYSSNLEETNYASKKIKKISNVIDLYSKNPNILYNDKMFKKEVLNFIIHLMKLNFYKKDEEFESSISEQDILKEWLKRKLVKIQKLRKEINKEKIFFNYKKFCNLHGLKMPIKATFNFYLKSINNEINYTGDIFIKNNKELLRK